MYLTVITKDQCEQVRKWRNVDISIYRTPFLLTEEMQSEFYTDVICNRRSDHRYWSVMDSKQFLGMIGLVNISLENRNVEISIVINPEFSRKGFGDQAFKLLLDKGFNELNLDNIYGECYACNPNIDFWKQMIKKYGGQTTTLFNKKFYRGVYWNSIYFNFERGCI